MSLCIVPCIASPTNSNVEFLDGESNRFLCCQHSPAGQNASSLIRLKLFDDNVLRLLPRRRITIINLVCKKVTSPHQGKCTRIGPSANGCQSLRFEETSSPHHQPHCSRFTLESGCGLLAPSGKPIKYSALTGSGRPNTSRKLRHPSCFIIDGQA